MKIKILILVVVVGIYAAAVLFVNRSVESEGSVVSETLPAQVDAIAGYKQWTRVNPNPFDVEARQAILCGRPYGARLELEKKNPHRNKFIVVYVNDIGRAAMMEQRSPKFPVGSVIVKEKLTAQDSSAPELLTVMRKRESGYDREKGDWEYMVFDGAGTAVQAQGKLVHCQACHLENKETDYVDRSYLPHDAWEKLK